MEYCQGKKCPGCWIADLAPELQAAGAALVRQDLTNPEGMDWRADVAGVDADSKEQVILHANASANHIRAGRCSENPPD